MSDQKKNKQDRKYKSPDELQATANLTFAPFGKNVSDGAVYLCWITGLITAAMDSRNVAVGCYTFGIGFIIAFLNWVSQFNKEDKSVNAILYPREWPKPIRLTLTFFQWNIVRFILFSLYVDYIFLTVAFYYNLI
eukprot:gb/GECH01008752.1/.p1 GENE.gb/GECH01008752.1/~~gb/GECH01008752.1/.p1  ORF type:complete len:135 (+),score=15.06 gb/GECH01008752.1/:1-405(+)